MTSAKIDVPPLLIATDGYFVEFNRANAVSTSFDGIAFSLSSTTHLIDSWTVAENPAALPDIVRSVRKLRQQFNVSISPVALFHPPSAGNGFPSSIVVPWALAIIAQATRSQVSSLTFAPAVIDALALAEIAKFCSGSKHGHTVPCFQPHFLKQRTSMPLRSRARTVARSSFSSIFVRHRLKPAGVPRL